MFHFCKKYDKIEIFQKSFLSTKTKNAPLNKQRNAACPEGRDIELKFFSDCRQFLHNTLQFQTELLICQTLLLQLVS